MEYKIRNVKNVRFLECLTDGGVIDREGAALDLVALCGENEVDTLMLYAANLAPDFFDLKTGLAGQVLLKLSNYAIRVAAVIPDEIIGRGRFYEMVIETNRRNDFRVFPTREKALDWIIQISTQ